jgi:hypothetical protein
VTLDIRGNGEVWAIGRTPGSGERLI